MDPEKEHLMLYDAELISVNEAARLKNKSPGSIKWWIKHGYIDCVRKKVGRHNRVFVYKDEVLAYNSRWGGSRSQKDTEGWVYVLEGAGLYKIGSTKNLKQRIRYIQTTCPVDIEVIYKIRTDKMATLERELQDMFLHKWLRDEWFCLSEKDVQKIAREYLS